MADVKTISILGATGSVGKSTAEVILSQPGRFAVQAVTAHRNSGKLAAQAIRLGAKKAVVADPGAYQDLKEALSGTGIEPSAGREALQEAASEPADLIMAAIVGMAGLEPVLAALKQGTCLAIANKEPLVAAGPLVLSEARKSGAVILPVDSEHNAIFQVFNPDRRAAVKKIVLTASGGPFRTWTKEAMASATPEQAVTHPNWSMGAKISVDSATMMNKALEVIEAHYLFDIPPEAIDVLVHPQSLVHALVEYIDGSVLAQLGAPDMCTPIAHCLAWPDRMETPGQCLDWLKLRHLEFHPLDADRFPAVEKAYECIKTGPAACIAFNAANEMAVDAFLNKRISFTKIFSLVNYALSTIGNYSTETLEDILFLDKTVREKTKSYINKDNLKKSAESL